MQANHNLSKRAIVANDQIVKLYGTKPFRPSDNFRSETGKRDLVLLQRQGFLRDASNAQGTQLKHTGKLVIG
jgi:hypothetical protein